MFGKSLFQSVLERLDAEHPREDAETVTHGGIRGFNAGLAFDTEPATGGEAVRQAYADMAAPITRKPQPTPTPAPVPRMAAPVPPAPPPPLKRPAHLDRLTPLQIAEDLRISDTDTPSTLAEKRRAFANRNHPDRHAPIDRDAATTRMTIANMLVDEALRRLKQGRPIGMNARGAR